MSLFVEYSELYKKTARHPQTKMNRHNSLIKLELKYSIAPPIEPRDAKLPNEPN
jgi:hypothetical protein